MSAKPQIVSLDFGRHNSDLGATTSRLIESGSWKKQRTIVLIPTGKLVPAKAALSWMNLYYPPNQGVVRWLCLNMEVGEAYSEAISQIIVHPDLREWEYLLTLEHDNIPPPDGLVKLIERMEKHPEYSVISGAYFTKGEGGVLQAWGDVRDPILNYRPQPPDPNGGLVECCGTGMGFALWRLSMFHDARLRRPWFQTMKGTEGQGVSTQDLYFFGDCRKYGYRCAVDCSVKVGHYDVENDIVW